MTLKIYKYFILIFISIVPLIQLNSIVDSTMLPRQIGFSIFILGGIFFSYFLKLKLNSLSYIHILLLALSLLSFVSILYSFNQAEAYYTSNKWLQMFALFTLLFLIFKNNVVTFLDVSKSILIFITISLLYQIYEFGIKSNLNLFENKNIYEINSLFGHKNLFSSIIFLCFPFIIYLIINEKKTIKKIAGYTILFFMLTMLILVQTKAVLIALLFTGLLGTFIYLNSLKKLRYFKVLILSSIALISVIGFYLLKNKLTLLSNNDTIVERVLLWQNTWLMIKENLIGGVGAGNWQVFFPKYGLENFIQTNYLVSDGYTTFQRPHNDFLWILSELGIGGFFLYSSIFLIIVFYGFSNIKNEHLQKDKTINIAILMTIIGYVLIALVDFPLERSEHQFILLILLAWVTNVYFKHKKSLLSISFQGVYFSLFLMVIFNFWVFGNRLNAETHARKLLSAHQKGNWKLMIKEANKASNYFYTIDNFSIPLQWYAGVALSALESYQLAKIEFEKAYQINPYQIHVLNNIASINEMEGNHDIALKFYNEALLISPYQPDALLNKSAVLFNKGQIDEAFITILNFKFDEKNDQFKNYYLAIARLKIKNDIENKKLDATKLPFSLSELKNDETLTKNFNYFKNLYLTSQN